VGPRCRGPFRSGGVCDGWGSGVGGLPAAVVQEGAGVRDCRCAVAFCRPYFEAHRDGRELVAVPGRMPRGTNPLPSGALRARLDSFRAQLRPRTPAPHEERRVQRPASCNRGDVRSRCSQCRARTTTRRGAYGLSIVRWTLSMAGFTTLLGRSLVSSERGRGGRLAPTCSGPRRRE